MMVPVFHHETVTSKIISLLSAKFVAFTLLVNNILIRSHAVISLMFIIHLSVGLCTHFLEHDCILSIHILMHFHVILRRNKKIQEAVQLIYHPCLL